MEAFTFDLQRFATGVSRYNTLDNQPLTGSAGDDSISNYGDSVTIDGGAGNDFISSWGGKNVTIDGGDGNDYIENGNLATIGAGNDSIIDNGNSVTIDGGAGNDHISNGGSNVTIDGGASDDTIFSNGNSVTIDGGAGNDHISNVGSNVKINGGDGNDTISLSSNAKNNLIEYTSGDGNDLILGFNATSTLKIGGGTGTYSTTKSGNNLFVCVGNDTITLVGAASLAGNIQGDLRTYTPVTSASKKITLTPTADTYANSIEGATIQALGGDDNLLNAFTGVSIDAGAGNDSVTNFNDSVTINGGTGNDSILNDGVGSDSVSISGGDGDDSVTNSGASVTIDGMGGNDYISNGDFSYSSIGAYSNVDGGAGNDSIYNCCYNVTIHGGAGNDYISNSYYASNASVDGGAGDDNIRNDGSNVLIDGGDGNDSIYNSYGGNSTINGGAGDDYIYNHDGGNVSIDGGAGKDTINNDNSTVSIDGGAGDDKISLGALAKNVTVVYAVGDGNDTIYDYNSTDLVNLTGGSVKSTSISGNDLILNTDSGSIRLVGTQNANVNGTVYGNYSSLGTSGNDNITNYFSKVTIKALGGDDIITNAHSSVSIDGGAGNDTIDNSGEKVTITGGAGNDTIKNRGNKVSISAGDGNDSVTNYGYSVTIDAGAGNDTIDNSDNYVTINAGAGNDYIYNHDGDNVSIDGGTGNDFISNYGANWHLSINGGDGDDSIVGPQWGTLIDGGAGNDYINLGGGNNHLDTVLGGTGNDSIYVFRDSHHVTIDAGADDDYIINNGASLSIDAGTGNDTIGIYNDNVSITGGAGNDQISLGTYGYYNIFAEKTLIEYADGDGKDTVYGFDTTSTLKIGNGTTDTYSKATVDNDIIVTVGDGSILLVGAATLDNVNISGEENTSAADNWTLADGVAKYKNLFTLSGLNPNLTVDELDSVINVDGNKVILSADALGKSNVTLTTTGNYSLALDEDCPTVTATEKGWTLDGTTATYHDAGKSDGYKLTNSKTVTYTPAVVGKALLTVSGVVEGVSEEDLNENLTVSGKVLTVTPDVVGSNFSVGAGYKVVFDEGDYGGSKFTGTTGRDTIEVNGSNLQIDGGKGNDTITSNGDGGNIYLIASTVGADVVVGYGDDDTIKITDGSSVTASVKGKDIIVKAGKATMTLKNAATGTHLNIVDADDETLIDQTFYADRTVADGEVKLLSTFNSTSFTATDENPNVDGSAVSRKFSLTGGDEDNTLIGGKGANFINGGGGSNELTGGKGNDTFVAGNGTDTITDYGVGTDKISLAADVTGFEVDGSDVILNFDDDKSMRIANGAGKKINFVRNGRTTPEIFMTGGKLSSNSKSITLASGTGSFDAGTVTTLVTIDGGLTENVFITGNAQSNKIFGGDGSDTLDGGAKNDTLTGGGGNDIFIYESGKDVIADYVSGEDKILLAAAPTSESLNAKGDVVLKFSSANQLTIKGGDEILFVTDGGEVTKTYLNDRIVGDDGVTLQSNFKATEFTLEELPKVDASATSAKITITGNNNDNTIIGSKGNNLIDGGAGDDILIGKGGVDTFVYSSGDDTISDYESRDRVSLTSAIENYDLSGDDVIISFGSSSLTIADAANSSVTFVEEVNGKVTTNVNVFAAEGIFNKAKTAVTLNADTSNYTANSSMLTIDGGLATGEIEVVGNAKANKIFAGDFGSTLNGGGGKDSLWGGNGSDTFIYSSGGGNDVIYNFGNDDALQIVGKFTASVVGEDVTFKVGSTANAITLKDYSATTFNVNGDTYRINGNNFVK